jgi:Ca2+:H+ antiporter
VTAPALGPAAERVLATATDEARRLGSDAIGAEHILLGLLREARASALFSSLGIAPELAADRLAAGSRKPRQRPASTDDTGAMAELAPTSHARRILDLAAREARQRRADVGPEHLLLAAFHEPRGALAKLLAEAAVAPAEARAALAASLGESPAAVNASRAERPPRPERTRVPPSVPPVSAAPPREARAPEPGPRSPASREIAPSVREPRVLPHLRPKPSAWGSVSRRLMLLAIPAALAAEYLLHAPAVAVFALACLAVLPLAGFMGDATEHLSARTGPTVGGLLNATFGNAAELIIAIVALQAGLVDLVKASITGSIIGNLLLILGLSLVAGGIRRPALHFNRTTAGMSATMLAAAVVGLVFPALFHASHPDPTRLTELRLSEGVALILIVTYAFSLLFSLKTHKWVVASEPHPLEEPTWGVRRAVTVLALATVGVALMSEILVGATRGVTASLPISETFLGLIIIPFIGNAAEHATAIVVARKGQTDLALQISLGSSTQIALLVAPVLVFVGVVMGRDMNLVFSPFEVMAVGLATAVTAISTLDGESHWFEGVQLLAVYAMIAVAAFFV